MRATVLVVEDDFGTLHPLSELLKLKGYAVMAATDAESGLARALERCPDLIISDIALPAKSGLRLISHVRGDPALSAIPIIVISGCGPAVLIEAESSGADICLEKPLDLELFWAAVDGMVEGVTQRSSAEAEPDNSVAGEIDHLVEELRRSSSKDERDLYLRRLKERILNPETQPY